MLIQNAELDGKRRDVRIERGIISEIAEQLCARDGEATVEADGGALLPGLHDHHIHLYALAAAATSIRCGPPHTHDASTLTARLQAAAARTPAGECIRGIGYHAEVAGDLDRHALDAWLPHHPTRIQHRSGALWVLNSAEITRLALREVTHPGIERDQDGEPTGRLFRADDWLRTHSPSAPDLSSTSRKLATYGVTGVTDATPSNGYGEWERFVEAKTSGALLQHLRIMGGIDLPQNNPTDAELGIERGARKLVLTETALPEFDAFCAEIAMSHAANRAVAIHCVTRVELWFAIAALETAGVLIGDRIEHASVAPPEARDRLARSHVTVVTQPNFLHERGDAYVMEVDHADIPHLYCGASFLAAGVPLGGGTDAPFGDPDPWQAIRAAVNRASRDDVRIGPAEALAPERALALFTTRPEEPGGTPRQVAIGRPADLCLLDRSWKHARRDLDARQVRATFCRGERINTGESPPAIP